MKNTCGTCKYVNGSLCDLRAKHNGHCDIDTNSGWEPKEGFETTQSIEFKRLNGLTPTESSCTLKLLEEVGEVMQILGKESGASGEHWEEMKEGKSTRLVLEYFDVAQSAVTAIFTLCEKYNLKLSDVLEMHEQKLRERGYLK